MDGRHRADEGRIRAVKESGTLESIVAANMERRYGPGFRERRPLRWEALRQTFLGTKLDGYFGCMNACLTHNVEPRLGQIDIPVLVVAGSEDPTTPPADNRLIASCIPGARYAEIAGGYHFPNVEFDGEFNRIMLDWLEGTARLRSCRARARTPRGSGPFRQWKVRPLSIASATPVMAAASSDIRNRMPAAISSGWARRFIA